MEIQVDFDIKELYDKNAPESLKEEHRNISNFDGFEYGVIQTQDKRLIQGMLYLNNNKPILIPEPDPCVIYFSNAQSLYAHLLSLKAEINGIDNFMDTDKITNTF